MTSFRYCRWKKNLSFNLIKCALFKIHWRSVQSSELSPAKKQTKSNAWGLITLKIKFEKPRRDNLHPCALGKCRPWYFFCWSFNPVICALFKIHWRSVQPSKLSPENKQQTGSNAWGLITDAKSEISPFTRTWNWATHSKKHHHALSFWISIFSDSRSSREVLYFV